MSASIRKIVTIVDETHQELGTAISPPIKRAAAIAIIANPFANHFQSDLTELIDIGEELGDLLGRYALTALGISGEAVEGYGKAALVGENGELEHAAAILHPKLGSPLRALIGKAPALIPSSKKRGTLGSTLDIPLGHKAAAYVRSHFDGMEVRVNDAPRADEIMVAVALTSGGRPIPRVGGLKVEDIKGEDGLR